jgi:hypothetical protein
MRYAPRQHDIVLDKGEWTILNDFIHKAQGDDGKTLQDFWDDGREITRENFVAVTGALQGLLRKDVQAPPVVGGVLDMIKVHADDLGPAVPPAPEAAEPTGGKIKVQSDGGGVIIITQGGGSGSGRRPPHPGNGGHHGGHGGPGKPEHGGGPEKHLV